MTRNENALGEISYTPVPNDKQIEFYDEAISYFKELRDFSKSSLATSAVMIAIERKANELRKNLASGNAYAEARKGTRETKQMLQNRFVQENRGKWLLTDFSIDSISRYKATFRENLFLAIKAKYTADKIIECLNNPVEYTNIDGTKHTAPLKPLIAIKSTGEQIFNLTGHKSLIYHNSLDLYDEQTLISGSHDKTMKFWNTPTRRNFVGENAKLYWKLTVETIFFFLKIKTIE
jgi:WD40 repeat protein